MKKFLVVVLCLVLAVGVIFVAGGLMLDKSYDLNRSIIIDASPRDVHAFAGDLEKWDQWMPWWEEDQSIEVTRGKKTEGVGASQTWTSEQGNGEITITASDRKTGIDYDMAFISGEKRMPSKGAIRYEEVGKKTRVTWSMKGEMNIPIMGGWLAATMDMSMGKQFDRGLANLKAKVEAE